MTWRRPSVQVVLVVTGLIGALGFALLVGVWCVGLVGMAESAGAVWFGLNREDGKPPPRQGERTIADVLEYARQAN